MTKILLSGCIVFGLAGINPALGQATEKYSQKILIDGKWGTGPGEFGVTMWEGEGDYPRHFVVDSRGKIFILDHINNRIQIFNEDGQHMRDIKVGTYRRSTEAEIEQSKKSWNKQELDFNVFRGAALFIDEANYIYLAREKHHIKKPGSEKEILKLGKKGRILEVISPDKFSKRRMKNKIKPFIKAEEDALIVARLKNKTKYKEVHEEYRIGKTKEKLIVTRRDFDGHQIGAVHFDAQDNFYICSARDGVVRKYNERGLLIAEIGEPWSFDCGKLHVTPESGRVYTMHVAFDTGLVIGGVKIIKWERE